MFVPLVATKWQHYLNYCKSKELTDFFEKSVSSFFFLFAFNKIKCFGAVCYFGRSKYIV